MERLVNMLRAAGDATRLRLFLLLLEAELAVSELTQILGQSQPRISRHLKLLCEADLLERFKEAHPHIPTKSGLMVGLGETNDEIIAVMRDLRRHGWIDAVVLRAHQGFAGQFQEDAFVGRHVF